MQWNHVVQVHVHIISRMEMELIKTKSILKCWACWPLDSLVEKNVIEPNKWCFVGLYLKSICSVRFSGKAAFWKEFNFTVKHWVWLIFTRPLGNMMFFVKKMIVKLSTISFYKVLKIPIMIIWSMWEKLSLVKIIQKQV